MLILHLPRFCFTSLRDWLAKIVSCSHAFPRAWHRLSVFASSSDWFVALFKSILIGKSGYSGFGFEALNRPYSRYVVIAHYKPGDILSRIDPLSFLK